MCENNRSEVYNLGIDINNQNEARVQVFNNIEKNSTVLDVGCACGQLGDALKKHKNCQVYGMEYNEGSIQIAKQTNSFQEIHQVDLNNFNEKLYENYLNFFDYIVFSDVLEHLLNPAKVLSIFRQFLKEDGYFVLSLPNVAHASIKANLLLNDFTYTEVGILDITHVKFFTHKNIVDFLSKVSLKIENLNISYINTPTGILGFQPENPYKYLPISVQKYICNDIHSYILQYVVKCKVSSENNLESHNEKMLNLENINLPSDLLNLRKHCLKNLSLAKVLPLKFNQLLLKIFGNFYLRFLKKKYKNRPEKLNRILPDKFELTKDET